MTDYPSSWEKRCGQEGADLAAGLSGWCDPSFARVRDAFAANFTERGETGAAACLAADGGQPHAADRTSCAAAISPVPKAGPASTPA